jgi:hypothetical protein
MSSVKRDPYKIKPITQNKKQTQIKPLGYELFPQLASSIYISASTKSGKTTLIYHIIKHCIDKNTKVYIFSPTVFIDSSYKEISRWLKKKKITHELHPHFISEDNEDMLNDILKGIIEEHQQPQQLSNDEEKSIIPAYSKISGGKIVKMPAQDAQQRGMPAQDAPQEEPTNAPKYMFIFDDLGNEMRKPSIYKLLLKQRHFKAKTILSSQYINNLMPSSIQQLDYVILFGGHNSDQLSELHKKLDLNISLEEFIDYYHEATKQKYNFLYIDRREGVFKHNFDKSL